MVAADPITAVLNIGTTLIERLFPDPAQKAQASLELLKMQQSGELAQMNADTQLATAQTDINKVEAQSSSLFVAGWRPCLGWVCSLSFGFKFIGGPLLVMIGSYFGHNIQLPQFDYSEMSTILMGILGLGTMRTFEKIKGATK